MNADLVIYTYSKCSTCRDAVRWLQDEGVAFQERAIRETPPSTAELRRMLAYQDGQLRRLFNTSGIEYRARGLAALLPSLSESQALELLASDGRLVKRPFVLGDGFGLLGFKADEWRARLLV